MERKRQREIALGVVAVLLIAVATWTTQSAGRRAPEPAAPAGGPAAAPQQPSSMSDVDLKALDAERPQPQETTRNPFRFKDRSAPPPPTAAVTRPPVAVTTPTGPTGPAEPPPPPRITLKYIGEMSDPAKPGQKVAILSDGRGVYYGRENDIIEGRYRVLKIGAESVELAYLDGRGRQTIRQTGQ
jgi:hypothetical protein